MINGAKFPSVIMTNYCNAAPRCWSITTLVVLFFCATTAKAIYLPDDPQHENQRIRSFEDQCVTSCAHIDGDRDDPSASNISSTSCGIRCRSEHCTEGCVVWERALNSSCQKVCNATHRAISSRELYCTVGCQSGVGQYYQQLKANIGVPPTPNLVDDTLAAMSLSLKWDSSRLKPYESRLLYLMQCRFEEIGGEWQYCRNQNWNGNNHIFLYSLQPYATYRFRLAIQLKSMLQNDEPLYSEPSSAVLTYPSGPPASAPVISKSMAIDHTRIYVNWKAGIFTNGPLYSYVLRLQQERHEAFQLKDIPISQDTFMFQNLDPNTNYSVTLTMRNEDGEGPATSVFVKTLPEPEVNSSEKPSLIVTSEYSIYLQNAENDVQAALLFQGSEHFRDSAIHVQRSLIYVSDASDRLYCISYGKLNATSSTLLLEPNRTDVRPYSLSVDWLNDELYVTGVNDATGYWEIFKGDLNATGLRKVVDNLNGQPDSLEVDPANGYLFWMAGDELFKVELGAFGEHQQILKKPNLGSFLVDYRNRRLLVAYQSENTIKSVGFDGKVIVDVRIHTRQPKFNNVTSISTSNGLFYWTNGNEVFTESYEASAFTYLHNVLFTKQDESFLRVHVIADENQPLPIPTNPPTDLQVLVLADRAKISWHEPALLDAQSRAGAWSNWSYALHIEDDINGEVIQEREIYGSEREIADLREHSLYTVKISAYTKAGDGPWSGEFKVQTLKKELDASILWLSNDTLLQSDLIGSNVTTLKNITDLTKDPTFKATEIYSYQDTIYIVGDDSRLYRYNSTSNSTNLVRFVKSASSVAIEWITKKLYWADPKKQVIFRSNLDGTHQEPITFAGVVKKLLIDSMEANLYWSTTRTVEVSRLNGEDRHRYRDEDDFNGRHVAGLTLDLENRFVYWIVGDQDGDFHLYRSLTADMLPVDSDILPELQVIPIPRAIGNSLAYISHRFVFLTSPSTAVTTDAYNKYPSTISNVTRSNLTTLTLKTLDPSLYPTTPRVIVRPEAVNDSSITIEGTWRDFNVSWLPVNNTSYGRVFYEVSFADYINVDAQPVVTTRTTLRYANADRLLPYSLVEVSIRAYTYWDSAPRVGRVMRSPQSVPSQPVDPRTFVESFRDPLAENTDYFITFRWNMPEFVNGPVLGFIVQCWFMVDNSEVTLCDSVDVPVSELEYNVHHLQANTSYYFQVCAYAEVGAGPYTDPISTFTENENPVPQLLVATLEDVKKVDIDQRTNVTITRHIAVEVAHLAAESRIFWINEMQELVTADVDGSNITKILTLNNTALSLCADWISRNVFWTEAHYEDSGISHIMKLDFTVWQAGVYKYSRILSRNRRIVNLDIAPLAGTMFWLELSSSNQGFVMQSDLSGNNVQPFFNHTEDCTCPFRPTIQPVFTIDNTDPQSPVMYWISTVGQLYIADIEGCICSLVLEAGNDRGLPPTSLTTDKSYIYWSDLTSGKIHFAAKTTSFDDADLLIREYPLGEVRSIKAIGKSLQPYPDSDCLIPQRSVYSVQQVSKSSTSITVRLPEPAAYLGCEKYSLPATLYTIDVTECKKTADHRIDEEVCENEDRLRFQTYWREFEAKGLKPFTDYRFKLTLANYYGDQEFSNVDQYGPGLIFRTGAGVPSEPEDVQAQPLTPTLAAVNWLHPRIWNAEYVRYRVMWRSVGPVDGVIPEGQKSVKDGELSTLLYSLIPGQAYLITVRAYPENLTDVYSQSEEKILKMYSEPNNITLTGVSPESLNVSWVPMKDIIINYSLEYTNIVNDRWQPVTRKTAVKNNVLFQLRNLKANEFYKFRLILRYTNYSEDFIWPNDGRFTFQTLEDIPTAPGAPTLFNLQNSNYQLRWQASQSLGHQPLTYILEGQIAYDLATSRGNDTSTTTSKGWATLYNGSYDFWDIQQNMHDKYRFRVRARNDYGYSNWSDVSDVVDLTDISRAMVIAQEHLGLIVGLSVALLTIVLLCFCYCHCPFHKKSKEDHKKMPIKSKPNVELATLREIPKGNFVEANALYVGAVDADTDDSLLPKIQREQISLAKFLGKGAFGEVFQGMAKELEGPGSVTPIAIKTLRKGATSQEKTEFVQEAKLMSHFKHKHVLRLLGVCLDTDPPLLLLELMAGGDLLSYLRISRSVKPTDPAALRLQDLLSMCEDVARGCQYLEELHFVHRDLACRNCLVSARERELRVVKIGDFGLARDIYKNDYYRKEGEGLLPVRWMAPESLVDGVFTSQSDVWAFGVLMWEITSLGQQPYQARTNLEVLHHVRAGGRLPKPLNCPPRLHQLMLKCWSAVDSRPSFKLCLEHIVSLRNNTEDCTLSPVNPGQFLVRANSYKSSHLKDNLSIQTLLQDADNTKPALSPKYSWLLDDSSETDDSKDPRAAYEIPKSIPVVVENSSYGESRYIEICSSEQNSEKDPDEAAMEKSSDSVADDAEDDGGNPRWNRTSVASLGVLEKKFDKTSQRSSTASLGEKSKSTEQVVNKQSTSGSYARLVGNGESVSSLSDWRRVKRIANDERERLNAEKSLLDETKSNSSNGTASTSLSYSTVTFPAAAAAAAQGSESATSTLKTVQKLHRTKSNLQNSRANIPLVINSGLLNMLRQDLGEDGDDDDCEDDVTYANIHSECVDVTDL